MVGVKSIWGGVKSIWGGVKYIWVGVKLIAMTIVKILIKWLNLPSSHQHKYVEQLVI